MIFVADLHAHPHTADELAGLLDALARSTASEPDAIAYSVRRCLDDRSRFQVSERYRNTAAWKRHMDMPYVAAALERFATLLRVPPTTACYEEIASLPR